MLRELRITWIVKKVDEWHDFPRKLILKKKIIILKKRIESENEERVRGGENARARVFVYVSVRDRE